MGKLIIGAVIAVLSGVGSNFGVNVQKHSHTKEEGRNESIQRPYHHRRIWWLGMLLVTIGALGDFFALGLAPQTLVASLGGGSTIIANVLFARLWLRQPLFISDVIGVFLVLIGVIIAALSSVEEGRVTIYEINKNLHAAPFIIYLSVEGLIVIFLLIKIKREGSTGNTIEADGIVNANSDSSSESGQGSPVAEVMYYALPTTTIKPNKEVNHSPLWNSTDSSPSSKNKNQLAIGKPSLVPIVSSKIPLYWAVISGILGGLSVLAAKCVMEMIFQTAEGNNQFISIGTYVIIITLLLTLFYQIHTLNLATMSGDTMAVFPVFQAFWIGSSNLSGIIFFQQVSKFSVIQWSLFPSAFVLIMIGIYLIAKHQDAGQSRFQFLNRML